MLEDPCHTTRSRFRQKRERAKQLSRRSIREGCGDGHRVTGQCDPKYRRVAPAIANRRNWLDAKSDARQIQKPPVAGRNRPPQKRRPKPQRGKPARTKTPNGRSTIPVPAATGSDTPCRAASRARMISPPTAADGTSVLIDSPIQRIHTSWRNEGRSGAGKSTHQAAASRNIGME